MGVGAWRRPMLEDIAIATGGVMVADERGNRLQDLRPEMLGRANALASTPEFYNTLTNNCTSNVVDHVNHIAPRAIPHGIKSLLRWVLWKAIRGAARVVLAAETGDTGRNAIFSQCLLTVAVR